MLLKSRRTRNCKGGLLPPLSTLSSTWLPCPVGVSPAVSRALVERCGRRRRATSGPISTFSTSTAPGGVHPRGAPACAPPVRPNSRTSPLTTSTTPAAPLPARHRHRLTSCGALNDWQVFWRACRQGPPAAPPSPPRSPPSGPSSAPPAPQLLLAPFHPSSPILPPIYTPKPLPPPPRRHARIRPHPHPRWAAASAAAPHPSR